MLNKDLGSVLIDKYDKLFDFIGRDAIDGYTTSDGYNDNTLVTMQIHMKTVATETIVPRKDSCYTVVPKRLAKSLRDVTKSLNEFLVEEVSPNAKVICKLSPTRKQSYVSADDRRDGVKPTSYLDSNEYSFTIQVL